MVDVTCAAWGKSSRSNGSGGNCVEVAQVWRKASRSNGSGGACAEAAPTGRTVAVRDSKVPDGAQLRVSPAAWRAFAHRVRTR